MVQVRNSQSMAVKFDQNLRLHFSGISDIVSKFAAGKVKPNQHRKVLEMDLSILSISFIGGLKLRGFRHFESASLLEYIIQLTRAEACCENLKDLVRCSGLLNDLEGRVFEKKINASGSN